MGWNSHSGLAVVEGAGVKWLRPSGFGQLFHSAVPTAQFVSPNIRITIKPSDSEGSLGFGQITPTCCTKNNFMHAFLPKFQALEGWDGGMAYWS